MQAAAEVHLWNALPPNVLQCVLQKLLLRDAWMCRNLSICWASAVRATVPVDLVIPATCQNLIAKVRRVQRLAQASSTVLHHRIYTFNLTEKMSVTACSNVLRSLTKQGNTEAPCRVLIQLQAPTDACLVRLTSTMATIAEATAQLASHNIKVCISLGVDKALPLPSPEVSSMLAPLLQHVGQVPTDQAPFRQHLLTDSHISALLPGIGSITSMSLRWRLRSHASLCLLTKFSNLHQLKLDLHDAHTLCYLSALKGLQELYLRVTTGNLWWQYCARSSFGCGKLLDNNQDSLLHVSLTAESWDDNTYLALLRLSKLQTFSLHIEEIQLGSVYVLSQLRPFKSMSVILKKSFLFSLRTLQEVTSCDSYITDLTLHTGPVMVSTMQHLTSLRLISDLSKKSFSQTCFHPQPRLQVLALVGNGVCMESTQLAHLVQSHPSLRKLSLHDCSQVTADILYVIVQLRRLTTFSVTDHGFLWTKRLCWTEFAFRAQQRVGMAQPKIHVTWTVLQTWGNQTLQLCVDYTERPVFCGVGLGDRHSEAAMFVHKCWTNLAYFSSRVSARIVWVPYKN